MFARHSNEDEKSLSWWEQMEQNRKITRESENKPHFKADLGCFFYFLFFKNKNNSRVFANCRRAEREIKGKNLNETERARANSL